MPVSVCVHRFVLPCSPVCVCLLFGNQLCRINCSSVWLELFESWTADESPALTQVWRLWGISSPRCVTMTGTACLWGCGSVGVPGVFHHNQLLHRPPTPKSVYACVFTYVCVFVSGDVGDSLTACVVIYDNMTAVLCALCVCAH